MKFNTVCVFEKKLSKDKREYYTLTLVELGKTIFLDDTEVKLLKYILRDNNQAFEEIQEVEE